jgi:hypothetical protein
LRFYLRECRTPEASHQNSSPLAKGFEPSNVSAIFGTVLAPKKHGVQWRTVALLEQFQEENSRKYAVILGV